MPTADRQQQNRPGQGRPAGTADVAFEPVDPMSEDARRAVGRYVAELGEIFGFDPDEPTEEEAAAFRPPAGRFFVAVVEGEPIACGGIRTIGEHVAEVKRMWIHPDRRGAGIATRLLAHLERTAADTGHTTIRLDTNEHLTAAVALYERTGYARVPRYNDNPHATHFFEKRLP